MRKLAQASGEQVQLLCPRQFEPVIELMPHTRLASGRGRWCPDRLWAYDWGGKTTRAAAITFCREKHLLIPRSEWLTVLHRTVFSHLQVEPYLDRYISHYFWDHTTTAAVKPVFTPLVLATPSQEWRPQAWVDEPYLLLNPVSAWKRKCYAAGKWAAVLAGAYDLGFTRVLMTGGAENWQRDHCMQIMAAASAKAISVIDISGKTSMKEFLYIISKAKAVLCIDGAATHLARAFQIPCVTLFGPSYRWMWHCDDRTNVALDASDHCHEHRPSPTHIPVEGVIRAIESLGAG
ncbi:MAG: glycosyltransferase family 9 protein [Prosthecobacter sp.]|uniref:glycosyltransferase family 9 protein n=1 Tax=Prosthecobacter sp. TaxID=1965333 RepID=UPI003903190F